MKYTPEAKQDYELLFANISLREIAEINQSVDYIFKHIDQYTEVEKVTNVPAYVVGIIHSKEASGNFSKHLHNGDSLKDYTHNVPAGRPVVGHEPPFTWVESAIDALTMPGQALHQWNDWSIGGIAFVLERYNGFGYRGHGVNSPYLWGHTTAYERGMYVADSTWSSTAVNKNPGGMALLKRMMELNLVPSVPTKIIIPIVKEDNPDWHIREAQRLLNLIVDGDPGPLTREAAAKWRANHKQS